MSKLVVIVGITGNQGGSVAEAFLADPAWRIRGTSRDPSKASSQALVAKGIEIVHGDVDDVESLTAAFIGANLIFGNTAFSNAFAFPTAADKEKPAPDQTLREWAYELEVQQGKNVVDAAATAVDSLDLFIWSTLSHAKKWSKGKYSGVYHFDSKAVVTEYLNEKYPKLAEKTSLLQLGIFITNWKWGPGAVPWEKRLDGSLLLAIPGNGDIPIPLIVPSDTGKFVKALSQVSPGKNLLAFGDLITWSEYVALWSKTTGYPAAFEKSTVAAMDKIAPGGYGEEIGEMLAYAQDFGYWAKEDTSVIFPKDLGIKVEATRIEDYIKNEDWSELINRPVTGS
ncbi:related to nitrogen metabolic regulation protein nmr [Rhynchosporium graminicola]|uniref:Related to nitrogen metabolic regulation protein nmr n=1 Tax=Rhynchosporium graminicola TaxID=2792576 RepID=A0A1E1LGC5_9HELO|nr:related to nitrogen metabolic regulation protein nmr [Rhynchosporium commune]